MKSYTRVAAAVIEKNGRILIGRRKAGYHEDKWEFPGGKIETDETAEECLRRELREELGIDAKVGQFVASSKFVYSHASIELLVYEAEIVSGELSLKDHKEIRWVSREHLKSYDFPEADWPIIEKIVSSRG